MLLERAHGVDDVGVVAREAGIGRGPRGRREVFAEADGAAGGRSDRRMASGGSSPLATRR